MADSLGIFGQPFMGGALLVVDSDDQGTGDLSLSFAGGVIFAIEKTGGPPPGGSGEGGLFFANG